MEELLDTMASITFALSIQAESDEQAARAQAEIREHVHLIVSRNVRVSPEEAGQVVDSVVSALVLRAQQ